MTNEQKYKTAEERVKAFGGFCKNEFCNQCNHSDCKLYKQGSAILHCYDGWLSLEAEEKPEPCPECNSKCEAMESSVGDFFVGCSGCYYRIGGKKTKAEAIAEHNRVARAVRAAEKGEAK